MAECPSCHSKIAIGSEFFGGLFTCPRCQAVYFISFDGTPEGVPTHTPPPEEPAPQTPPSFETSQQHPRTPSGFENPQVPSGHEDSQQNQQNSFGYDGSNQNQFGSQASDAYGVPSTGQDFSGYQNQGMDSQAPGSADFAPYESPAGEAQPASTGADQFGSYQSQSEQSVNPQDFGQGSQENYGQTEANFAEPEPVPQTGFDSLVQSGFENPPPPKTTNPLQDIVNFGNSETVGTALTYRLLIKGLDIVQHIEELRDVLSDSKLGLKFDELKSRIKNGQLLIEKIEASQAAVLAQRLRTLPVEMVWEQKIYE